MCQRGFGSWSSDRYLANHVFNQFFGQHKLIIQIVWVGKDFHVKFGRQNIRLSLDRLSKRVLSIRNYIVVYTAQWKNVNGSCLYKNRVCKCDWCLKIDWHIKQCRSYRALSLEQFGRYPSLCSSDSRSTGEAGLAIIQLLTQSKVGNHDPNFAVRIRKWQQHILRFDVTMNWTKIQMKIFGVSW